MHLDLLHLLALTPICHGGWVVCLGRRRRDGAFCNLSREKHRVLYLLFKTSNPKALIVHWSLLPVLDLFSSDPALLCGLSGADMAHGGSDLRHAMAWLSAFE